MSDLIALEVSLAEDLLPLSQYLWRHGVAHRIVENEGQRLLLVKQLEQIDSIRNLYAQWQRGEALPEQPQLPKTQRKQTFPWRRVPVTLTLIALSVIGFLIASFSEPLLALLTYFQFAVIENELIFGSMQKQYWRLLTPIFLHFSLLHIVFNMLWLWDLGRRIELVQGRVRLLGIVLLIGVASNIAQGVTQTALFGGMSGVDYGLLGYCWIWGWLRRHPILHVPVPVMIVMLAMLLLSMTGIMQLMGVGAIANAAHVGGLVMGLLLGLATVLISKKETAD
jgi:GlpG protein